MKRTEKYKDSYQYDDQYQQRNQKSREYQQRQQRRQSEENYRRNEPRQEYHHQNQGDYDENANRYYNDRDFRREQLLEEENEKNKKSKRWLIAIIAILLLIIGIFATKSYIDHKKESDNKQHTYNAMMYLKIINKKFKIKAIISRNKLKMQKMILKIK